MSHHSLIKLEKTIVGVHGELGQQWWQNLPHLLESLAGKYQLTLRPPFLHLSYHYVLPVLGPHNEEWVLKLGVPHDGFSREIHALRHFKGIGCVRLMNANPHEGWIIIERLTPGKRLVDLKDDAQAIPIAVNLMQRLWSKVSETQHFISISEWIKSLSLLNTAAFLQQLIKKPLRDFVFGRAQELLARPGEQVLLHGDLHHYNILQHHSEWRAIDPTGLIGEREFEIGAFLRNPFQVIEEPFETQALARNLDWVLELTSFDRKKVLSWCIIQAVLCACWYFEGHQLEKTQQLAAYAERLYSLTKIRKSDAPQSS